MNNAPVIFTLEEAADFLKVSQRTLWGLANDRKLPFFRVGSQLRFQQDSLLEWAESQSQQQEPEEA